MWADTTEMKGEKTNYYYRCVCVLGYLYNVLNFLCWESGCHISTNETLPSSFQGIILGYHLLLLVRFILSISVLFIFLCQADGRYRYWQKLQLFGLTTV